MESRKRKKISENRVVAHTDTLLQGTWLWFIYLVCGKKRSTGYCVRGEPFALPSGSIHVANAAIILNLNSKFFTSLLLCFFFQECEWRTATELVSLAKCLTKLRITEMCDASCVKPLDSRGLWDSDRAKFHRDLYEIHWVFTSWGCDGPS